MLALTPASCAPCLPPSFFPNRHSGGWHCHGPYNCSTWTQENRWARAITWYHNAPKPSAPGLATWDGMIADVAGGEAHGRAGWV